MPPLAGWRPDVPPVDLDPRMGNVIGCIGWQADHELGIVALLAEQLEENKRARQTAGTIGPKMQGPVYRVAQQSDGIAYVLRPRMTELACEVR